MSPLSAFSLPPVGAALVFVGSVSRDSSPWTDTNEATDCVSTTEVHTVGANCTVFEETVTEDFFVANFINFALLFTISRRSRTCFSLLSIISFLASSRDNRHELLREIACCLKCVESKCLTKLVIVPHRRRSSWALQFSDGIHETPMQTASKSCSELFELAETCNNSNRSFVNS